MTDEHGNQQLSAVAAAMRDLQAALDRLSEIGVEVVVANVPPNRHTPQGGTWLFIPGVGAAGRAWYVTRIATGAMGLPTNFKTH